MTAYLLNLLDLAFTLHALGHGARECNPLMGCVPVMVAYKVFAVGALCWWLKARSEQAARMGLAVCAAVFGAVNVWHIVNIAAVWAA